MNSQCDVLVVGSGIAGLAVAQKLTTSGLEVIALEARERVGGRLLSVGDVGLDLGATWFWDNEPRVAALAAELGLSIFEQYTDGDAVYHSAEGAQRLDGNPVDVPSLRLAAGAQGLAQAVANALPDGTVRLGQEVRQIRSKTDTIEAKTTDGVFSAAHLVLAVPPALAVSSIEFTPRLPERLAGLARITPVWMGAITKVVARYDHAFWRQNGLAGAGISHFGPMRELHDMSGPTGSPAALFGFTPATGVGQPTVTAEEVLQQLVAMFGPEAAEPKELILHDWRHEPFTSPPEVERLTATQLFGHPAYASPALDGRLHWASTETSAEFPGHIEGALTATERAANAILACLSSKGQSTR